MKTRPNVLTFMGILAVLCEGVRIPTRLAQACNINYVRLGEYLTPLETKGLIRKEMREGHEVYAISELGLRLYQDWENIWQRLQV